MTKDELKNNLSAYAEYLSTENVNFLAIAMINSDMVVCMNKEFDDDKSVKFIAGAMKRDEDFERVIIKSVVFLSAMKLCDEQD